MTTDSTLPYRRGIPVVTRYVDRTISVYRYSMVLHTRVVRYAVQATVSAWYNYKSLAGRLRMRQRATCPAREYSSLHLVRSIDVISPCTGPPARASCVDPR